MLSALSLTAQVVAAGSLVHWAIVIVVLVAIFALVLLAMRTMGVAVPPFVAQAGWIVVVAVVVILAIVFLARLVGGI